MEKAEALRLYNATTAATRTVVGFSIGKVVYMVMTEITDDMIDLTNESSKRGGKMKLRLNLNSIEKMKLKNKAIKVGTIEILNTIKGNKGDSWEKWVVEHYGQVWHKSNKAYYEDGDFSIAGEKVQVKWENATLAKLETILQVAKLM